MTNELRMTNKLGSRWVGRKEEMMYTGTLIDDLMKTVEHNEKRSLQARSQEEKLTYFYSMTQSEQIEPQLRGVA